MNKYKPDEPIIEEMEQFFNKHFIQTDANGSIIRGFTDAFEKAQDGDILVNEQGGRHFRLSPGGEENPPLFTMDGIPMYRWEASLATESAPWRGVIKRTDAEIEADRQAREASPQNKIAVLNAKIHDVRNIVQVMSHLYDVVNALCSVADTETLKELETALAPIVKAMSDEEFEMVQLEAEPAATGRSEWRGWIDERDKLEATTKNPRGGDEVSEKPIQ